MTAVAENQPVDGQEKKAVVISAHQPNLLPSTRFFYKLANSDLFDLRHKAQFIERGYIHRVKMRGEWFALPIMDRKKVRTAPIDEVRIDLPAAKKSFRNTMQGRYANSRFYKTRGRELIEKFDSLESDLMWEINLDLIVYVRDLLGIDTPIHLGVPSIGTKAEGVLSNFRIYPDITAYLSGIGAKKYMEDTTIFDEAGIEIIWSRHAPVTEDSIVSILMDHSDPMEFVLREEG